MFGYHATPQLSSSEAGIGELIYHGAVRKVRSGHANALVGLLMNIFQTVMLLVVFYLMLTLMGARTVAIRGDFVLYLMSGIFMYMTHAKALGAIAGSEGPASAMMKHAPMTTAIAIGSAALSSLYLQTLSMLTVLGIYHIAFNHITILDPVMAYAMFLVSWFSGCAIGMVSLALKPWMPGLAGFGFSLYGRANMIASGKMFLANTMPGYMLVYFTWNPLFHTIDQTRGFVFINYHPHYSNLWYPIYVSLVLMMIGLMGEFVTRRHASVSWAARR
jgi:ABC-type polysaccharide/polyol phosphate export permease